MIVFRRPSAPHMGMVRSCLFNNCASVSLVNFLKPEALNDHCGHRIHRLPPQNHTSTTKTINGKGAWRDMSLSNGSTIKYEEVYLPWFSVVKDRRYNSQMWYLCVVRVNTP